MAVSTKAFSETRFTSTISENTAKHVPDHFDFSGQSYGQILGSYTKYYRSRDNLNIDQILQLPKDQWIENQTDVPNFTITSDYIWLKLSLHNLSNYDVEKIVHLDYALLDYIEVYYKYTHHQDITHRFITGSFYPYSTRPLEDAAFAFPATIEAQQTLTIFFKLSNDGFIQAPITIWDKADFYQARFIELSLIFSFIAMIVILGLYNIFLYFSVSEKPYLLFAIMSLCIAGYVLISSGLSIQFFGLDLKSWNERWMTVLLGAAIASASLLPNYTLGLKHNFQIYYRICRITHLGGWAVIALAFLLPHSIRISITFMIALVLILTVVTLSAHLWYRRVIGAKLFSIAWNLFFVGCLFVILNRLNILPRSPLTEYIVLASSLMGLLLLSLSLASKINTAKKDQSRAQSTSLKLMQKFYNLFHNSLEGIFTASIEGEILEANPAFLNMLGFSSLHTLKERQKKRPLLSQQDVKEIGRELREQGKVEGYEVEFQRDDQSIIWLSLNIRRDKFDSDGEIVISGAILDISNHKESQKQLQFLAEHDPLTGLYNRRKFMQALSDSINNHLQYGAPACVIYLDLDQFKVINDTCGHTAGDRLLQDITAMMSGKVPLGSCLARLGGDEFAIVLTNSDQSQAYEFSEKMRQAINEFKFVWHEQIFSLGASIGIVELNDDCRNIEYVLSLADTACFAAKDQGRNCIHIYDHNKGEAKALKSEMHRVAEINQALEHNNFVLYQQTIVATDPEEQQKGLHYEVLLRMINRAGEIMAPGLFMPAAERYNLMPAIDRWVLVNYCGWLEQHPDHINQLKRASINLSGALLNDTSSATFIISTFRQHNIPAEKICFEITESTAIVNMDRTLPLLKRLKDEGFNLALDDFGTGFASYGYLKNLPFNTLKIDGSFIKDIVSNETDFTIVKSINDVAKALEMTTVAEYVENRRIHQIIEELGIDYAQGYGIAKPTPLSDLVAPTK
jgi:diguanylate cyclase (GGDEF)-like protein/PAS domain S-box-containing protein